jgi:hypothetical protein
MMAACHMASKASLTQGAALLRTALAAFPEECAPLAALLDQCSSAPPPPGSDHAPPPSSLLLSLCLSSSLAVCPHCRHRHCPSGVVTDLSSTPH